MDKQNKDLTNILTDMLLLSNTTPTDPRFTLDMISHYITIAIVYVCFWILKPLSHPDNQSERSALNLLTWPKSSSQLEASEADKKQLCICKLLLAVRAEFQTPVEITLNHYARKMLLLS